LKYQLHFLKWLYFSDSLFSCKSAVLPKKDPAKPPAAEVLPVKDRSGPRLRSLVLLSAFLPDTKIGLMAQADSNPVLPHQGVSYQVVFRAVSFKLQRAS